jgi:hypothetical protein
MIYEVKQTEHYQTRKKERSHILDLKIPLEALSGYNPVEVKAKVKEVIVERLMRILKAFESSTIKNLGGVVKNFPILQPVLKVGDEKYPIEIITTTEDKGEERGHSYEVVKIGDSLITLLIRHRSKDPYEETKNHLKRAVKKGRQNPKVLDYPIDVVKAKNSEFEIDLEELIKGKELTLQSSEINQQDLPYKIRTDYRKDAKFTHNQYGTGTIVNTSVGVKGDPGGRGKLDWVDVDFGKPFLKGGKFTSIRRIEPVYAVTYFKNRK